MKKSCLFAILFALAIAASGQTPTPTPLPAFKTYADAMAAGKAAFDKTNFEAAEAAYAQAVILGSTDEHRFDALVKQGGAFERISRTERSNTGKYRTETKTVVLFPDAVAAYRKAAGLAGISPDKKAEAMMLIADIYSSSYKSGHLPAQPLFGKSWKESAREEFTKVMNLVGITADTKARALMRRAGTYNTLPLFGKFDAKQMQASADDLEAAFLTAGAADHIKADALKELASLGKRIGDVNVYFKSIEQITKLPKARPGQVVDAYDALALLYLENAKLAEARKAAADGLAVPKAEAADRAKLYRDLAVGQLMDPAHKAQTGPAPQAIKLANAELDKAVKGKDLADDDRARILITFGEYFQQLKLLGATETAVAQFQKVLALRGLPVKLVAEAQYGIGESYRIAGRTTEAIAAYEKVGTEDGRIWGYARERLRSLRAATPKD
jgi:hypothetical protein